MALRARINGLALCAGIGGIELGLRAAVPGFKTVCYVESNAYAAAVIAARMEEKALDPAPIWDDLATFDCRPWRGVVDCVTAGFPCQPVSFAGRRRGKDDERWLWPVVAGIVEAVQPSVVFLENVPGIISLGGWSVVADLARLGFDAEWGLFSAAEVGANHIRKRWFLLAYTAGGEDRRILQRRLQADSAASGEDVSYPAPMHGEALVGDEPHGDLPSDDGDADCTGRQDVPGRAARPEGPRFGAPRRPGWWDVEPDVGRVADGVPYRVDRLRCLGNAVVPAQAASAFKELANRITGR